MTPDTGYKMHITIRIDIRHYTPTLDNYGNCAPLILHHLRAYNKLDASLAVSGVEE